MANNDDTIGLMREIEELKATHEKDQETIDALKAKVARLLLVIRIPCPCQFPEIPETDPDGEY